MTVGYMVVYWSLIAEQNIGKSGLAAKKNTSKKGKKWS